MEVFASGDDDFKIGPVVEVASGTKPAVEDPNLILEQLDVKHSDAHKTFKGKILVSEPDFASGSGYKQRKEYSIAGPAENESLEERFNRLRSEVEGFIGDIKAAENSPSPNEDEATHTVEMAKHMANLQSQLQKVKLDVLTGDWNGNAPGALQTELNTRLLGELSKAKAATTGAGDAKSKDGDTPNTVTYELFYNAEQAKFADSTRAGELDVRIAKLEKAIGKDTLSKAAAELNEQDLSLSSAVSLIAQRVSILGSESTEAMSSRLNALVKVADEAAKKKAASTGSDGGDDTKASAEYADKVDELYATTVAWDGIASSVPELIERLTSLKTLHEDGMEFGKTLAHLQSTQNQIRSALSNDTTVLSTLEKSFKENMTTIEGNFTALNSRVEAINATLKK